MKKWAWTELADATPVVPQLWKWRIQELSPLPQGKDVLRGFPIFPAMRLIVLLGDW